MSGDLPQHAPVQLFRPPGSWGLLSVSPFCIKLEVWLKLVGIPYQTTAADPRRAPRGKIPYVSINGALLGDSQLIIEHLTERRGVVLDAELTAVQRAWGHTLRKTAEDSLYFHIVHARWVDADGFAAYRSVIGALMPAPVRLLGPHLVRRMVRRQLHGQGLGRFDDADRTVLAAADADALQTALSEAPFALGDEPHSVDASLYAMLVSILAFPVDSALKTLFSRPVFTDYIARMDAYL